MKYKDIKRHLAPYSILQRRKTTINHAFASAIAPCDEFDPEKIKEAIRILKQDPEKDLRCVYCGGLAETWDHVFATVMKSSFSGAGHRIGNLLPSCKPCNSRKGNKNWEAYLAEVKDADSPLEDRKALIRGYLQKLYKAEPIIESSPEHKRLVGIRLQILNLMKDADDIASAIRNRSKRK